MLRQRIGMRFRGQAAWLLFAVGYMVRLEIPRFVRGVQACLRSSGS